jgi:hypothetical protein
MQWDRSFCGRSPMFEPYVRCASELRGYDDWPPREALDALLHALRVRNAGGAQVQLVAPQSGGALAYEAGIYDRGELAVRQCDWHDLLNVLVWCTFPRTKAAVNALHVRTARGAAEAPGGGMRAPNRGRRRDALTLFDESGAIVASTDGALLDDLRTFRWKDFFWRERSRFRECVRVYVFGHALLEKARSPYIGMTAHAITVEATADVFAQPLDAQLAAVDGMAANAIESGLASPRELAPLPLLGVPGWWGANEEESFYDDAAYFRPGRMRDNLR